VTYDQEMNAGRACLTTRDWVTAYRHFQKAHDLGHPVRSQHLAAHRAALKAACHGHHLGRALYQLLFLGFASITSRDTRPGRKLDHTPATEI